MLCLNVGPARWNYSFRHSTETILLGLRAPFMIVTLGCQCTTLLYGIFVFLFISCLDALNCPEHSLQGKGQNKNQKRTLDLLVKRWWCNLLLAPFCLACDWLGVHSFLRYTRDQKLHSASPTCRQTVNIDSGCVLGASTTTQLDHKNCVGHTVHVRCSHLRNRSQSPRAQTPAWTLSRTEERHSVTNSSHFCFLLGSRQLPFCSPSSFNTLWSSRAAWKST